MCFFFVTKKTNKKKLIFDIKKHEIFPGWQLN